MAKRAQADPAARPGARKRKTSAEPEIPSPEIVASDDAEALDRARFADPPEDILMSDEERFEESKSIRFFFSDQAPDDPFYDEQDEQDDFDDEFDEDFERLPDDEFNELVDGVDVALDDSPCEELESPTDEFDSLNADENYVESDDPTESRRPLGMKLERHFREPTKMAKNAKNSQKKTATEASAPKIAARASNAGTEIRFGEYKYSLEKGLTTEQASASREKHGRNELTPPAREPWWKELLSKFDDPTIKILLASAVLSLIVTAIEKWGLRDAEANFIDTIGVFIAVALATLVGFFSERKSAKEFEALNKIKEDVPIKVVRDGQLDKISIKDVVVGDVVRLESGDKLPADGIVLDATNLFVDQATFTGESVPVRKIPTQNVWDVEAQGKVAKMGADDFAMRGTTVSDGRGWLLVTSVGDATEMGKIADALASAAIDDSETPLVQKLAKLAQLISVVGVSAATAIFSVMTMLAICHSEVSKALVHSSGAFASIAILALLLGVVLERFAAKPFFASMGTPVQSKKISALIVLPCFIALFAIFAGIWGMMNGQLIPGIEEFSSPKVPGVELLKSVLLAFVVAVTIIVVAVPEGLPMMVTISLALNTMKMARENCLIRRLIASETIGSATIICTDKTGTLTENKMTPVRVFADGKVFERDRFEELKKGSGWERLVRGIAVNSQANLRVETVDGAEKVSGVGNPTECALLTFLRDQGVDYHAERDKAPVRVYELGHNSDRKFSVSAYT